jgi:hypothetical protein
MRSGFGVRDASDRRYDDCLSLGISDPDMNAVAAAPHVDSAA